MANGKIKEDLEFLSQQVGGRAIDVISGRRTQNAQDRLRKDFNERAAKRSQHTYGVAADIKIPGLSKPEVAKAAFDTGRFERVNLYTDPVAGIHVDYLDVGPGTQMHIDWMRVDP